MMVEDSEKNLWLGTYGNGIVRVTFGDSLQNPKKVSFYKEKEGLPSMRYVYPFLIKGKIIFGNEYGIYAHNPKNDRFEPYCELDTNLCNKARDIVKMYESPTGEIWILPYKNKFADLGYLKPQKDKSYEWIYKPFLRLPEMEMEFIYPEKDGIVWIGGTEGLFRYDSRKDLKNYEADFQTLIRKVSIGEDSVIYYGHPSSLAKIENSKGFAQGLDYSYNHIKFEFAAPFFDQEEKTLYSYQLEGFDEAWSDWTSEGVAKYTYLLEGNYVFKVKARNIYDQESSIASYSFRISPPFYRTWWAYGIYAILAAFGVFGIVKWNTSRLEKDKIRLETIVKERTAEVMLQKEEIQQQAEEIMVQRDNILETYQNNKMLIQIWL